MQKENKTNKKKHRKNKTKQKGLIKMAYLLICQRCL